MLVYLSRLPLSLTNPFYSSDSSGCPVGSILVDWKTGETTSRKKKVSENPANLQPISGIEITRSGKHTKNYGKSQFLMGKSTIDGHFQ
jgi:hypothetical protein